MRKNKTLATWLAFLLGPFGLHRFYLHGLSDKWGWLLPVPTLIGLYGVRRIRDHGIDDPMSWVLVPFLGLTMAACALTAIVYGLATPEKWNAQFNPTQALDAPAGRSNWLTIFAIVLSLMVGTVCLLSSIVYGCQRYFEYQIEEGRKISQ
jgi:TM2 domain